MKKILTIGQQVKIIRPGYADDGLTGIVKGINQWDDGTSHYDLKGVHFPCPNGGSGWIGTSQVKDGEYEVIEKTLDAVPLTINNLEKCFYEASKQDRHYVGVLIAMEGFPKSEVIINANPNFDSKFDYYKKTYDEHLNHKYAKGVKIVGFTYGNEFADIENDLGRYI